MACTASRQPAAQRTAHCGCSTHARAHTRRLQRRITHPRILNGRYWCRRCLRLRRVRVTPAPTAGGVTMTASRPQMGTRLLVCGTYSDVLGLVSRTPRAICEEVTVSACLCDKERLSKGLVHHVPETRSRADSNSVSEFQMCSPAHTGNGGRSVGSVRQLLSLRRRPRARAAPRVPHNRRPTESLHCERDILDWRTGPLRSPNPGSRCARCQGVCHHRRLSRRGGTGQVGAPQRTLARLRRQAGLAAVCDPSVIVGC